MKNMKKKIRQIKTVFGLTGIVAIGEAILGFIQGGIILTILSVLQIIAAFTCFYVVKNAKSLITKQYF